MPKLKRGGNLTAAHVTADDILVNDTLVLNGAIRGDGDVLTVAGKIRGDGPNGVLRVKTAGGVTAIGAENWGYSHFSTTLPYGFYFYQPVMLGDGKLSSGFDKNLQLRTYSTTRMVIHKNGNVGIGVDTVPQYKLEVNGDVGAGKVVADNTITRKMVADTVTTDLVFSADTLRLDAHIVRIESLLIGELLVDDLFGADFVFDKDYKLRSLQEVSDYIQENKHLPDIPSAKDMQENGVNATDLLIRLLQKVEEQTLYILQQEKRIQELEKMLHE